MDVDVADHQPLSADEQEQQCEDLEDLEDDQQLLASCKDEDGDEMWDGEEGEADKEGSGLLRCGSRPSGLCQVCGDKAGGRYFNAIVCIPCKAFYLRMALYVNGQMEPCEHGGHCEITPTSRSCRSCRYQRCLVVGMCRRERPMPVISEDGRRACLVCGDTANGLHFGVQTCEGCKKFFRRAVREGGRYTCKAGGLCDINTRTRNACRYCRYRKCLDIGMSLKAVHIGRPTRMASAVAAAGNKHAYPRVATQGKPFLSRHILPKFRSSTAASRQDHGQLPMPAGGMTSSHFIPCAEWLQLAAAARGFDDVRLLPSGWPTLGILAGRANANANGVGVGVAVDESVAASFGQQRLQQQQFLPPTAFHNHAQFAVVPSRSGSSTMERHVTPVRPSHQHLPALVPVQEDPFLSEQLRAVSSSSSSSGSDGSSRSNSFSSNASSGEDLDQMSLSRDISTLDLSSKDTAAQKITSTDPKFNRIDDDSIAALVRECDEDISSSELLGLFDETDAYQIVNLIRLSALEYEKFRIQLEKINVDTKLYYEQLCAEFGKENRDKAMQFMGGKIRQYVRTSCRYVASLPAFNKLRHEDRVTLMKNGESLAFILLSSIQWYQADTHTFGADFYCNIPSPGRADYDSYVRWLTFAAKLSHLQLDVYEASLFVAVVVLATAVAELVDVAKVEQARKTVLVALKAYVIAKRGANSRLLLSMFSLLPDLKAVADERLIHTIIFLPPDADSCHDDEDDDDACGFPDV